MINLNIYFIHVSDPSASEGPEVPGVPKFLPYNSKDKYFMAINSDWELRNDYTNVWNICHKILT